MSALAGLRVVELASERIAWAGKLLGDMGADVVLVEPPGGDPSRRHAPFANDSGDPDDSLYWWHYNTSKRSVVLDLEQPAARDAFRALVRTADVLIESESPGRLADLGLDYADLVAVKADLIHVSMTPFGRETSRRDEPATDLTLIAGGGPAWSCGYDDHSLPPIRGGGNQGYQIGCHYAVMSALTAIFHHGATGEGQLVDVSMHAAANVTTEMASYFYLVAGETVQRQTGRHAMPERSMPVQMICADGRYVSGGMPPRTPAGFGDLYDWLDELGLVDQLPEAIFLDRARERDAILWADVGVDDEVTAIFSAAREAIEVLLPEPVGRRFLQRCTTARHHGRRDPLTGGGLRERAFRRAGLSGRGRASRARRARALSRRALSLPRQPLGDPASCAATRGAPGRNPRRARPRCDDAWGAGLMAEQRDGETSASPRSIEQGARDFLETNRAPAEIEADWNDWITRSGSEVWARPGLSRAQRSLATIAVLCAQRDESTLRVHVEAGLANGLSRREIAEVIMHTAVYSGVPQALRGMQVAYEVFARLDRAASSGG